MLVVDGVVNEPSGAPRPHQAHAAQNAQLVRYGGLADSNERGDVAHAELSRGQCVEDANPRRIPEHAEGIGQRLDGPRLKERRLPFERVVRPVTGGRVVLNPGFGYRHMNV